MIRSQGSARQDALAVLRAMGRGASIGDAMKKHRRSTAGSERALTTQLVFGVARHQRYLDAWIDRYAKGRLDPEVRDILRVALFQVGFLDRIPAYAVVHGAVEEAKRVNRGAAGLVNAVLRRGAGHPPPPAELSLAVRYSHPDWLVERWSRRYGSRLEQVLEADQMIPPMMLRVDLSRMSRDDVLQQIQALGVQAVPSPYLPESIRVSGALWLEDLSAFRAGVVSVQDESGMLVNWVLDAHPGDAVLDMAVGVGGKALHALERTAGQIRLTAVDVSRARLGQFRDNLVRTGYEKSASIDVVEGPSEEYAAAHENVFDRVILDAPCSGLGVLRRRVDARWVKLPTAFPGLAERQERMLRAALTAAKPGGVVVYSTCSTEPEETRTIIDKMAVLSDVDDFCPMLPHPDIAQYVDGGMLELAPGDLAMDGFFIARLRKRGNS